MKRLWLTAVLLSQLAFIWAQTNCPSPREISGCGSACDPTCDDPSPVCIQSCVVNKCQCPRGSPIWFNNDCITADRCPKDPMEALVEQCIYQATRIDNENLKRRLRSLMESETNHTEDSITSLLTAMKEDEQADRLGKCIEFFSSLLTTSAGCTKDSVFNAVCRNYQPGAIFEECPNQKCDGLIAVLNDTSCFPEDDSKYYLIERITELIFDDPACWGKFKDIPLEALLTLDPFKVADFLTDSELLGYLLDEVEEIFPFLPCDAKKILAEKAATVVEADFLDESLQGVALDVAVGLLPYLDEEACNFVADTEYGMLLVEQNLDKLKLFIYECRAEDNPSKMYLASQSARKKRQAEDEIETLKRQLASENQESCEKYFSCGKIVAKKLLKKKMGDLEAQADPCDAAISSFGGLYNCLPDKQKESLLKCNSSDQCTGSFNSKEKVNEVKKRLNCDVSASTDCGFWCENVDPSTINDPCSLLTSDRAECLKTKKCFNKFSKDVCKCAGAREHCEAALKELNIQRPTNLDSPDFNETIASLKATKKEDRTKKEVKMVLLDSRSKIKDKTARELAEDPDLFIENFAVIKPQVVQEAMDLIMEMYPLQDVIDYINSIPGNLKEVVRVAKVFINDYLENATLPFDDIPDVVKNSFNRVQIENIDSDDFESLVKRSDVSQNKNKAKFFSEKYLNFLKERAGSNDTANALEDFDPDAVDPVCSKFIDKDNFESVPESVRGLVIDITMDVELFSEFERSDICMKHLKLIGKDLANASTVFEDGDELLDGIECVMHLSAFEDFIDKATAYFLFALLSEHAPTPECLPPPVLAAASKLIDKLDTLSLSDVEGMIWLEYGFFFDFEGSMDILEEYLDELEFDLSEEIEEAREDCKQRKKMLRKNSRDKTTLKNNQDSMENKLKQKKREKLQRATYTCDYIQSLGSAVTTLTTAELQSIQDSEFLKCVDEFGQYEYATDSHYDTLLMKSLTVLDLSACDITIDDVDRLDNLVYGLTVDNLACLTLDNDLMFDFGVREGWNTAQINAMASRYLTTGGHSASSLTGTELLLMNNAVCGMTDIDYINPEEFAPVVVDLGEISTDLVTSDCLTSLANILKHENAYGSVDTWDSADFGYAGIFIAGLSASDLNMADQDSVDEMSSDGLTHIPPAVFGDLTTNFLGYLSGPQARSVTSDQEAALSDAKKQVLYEQAYGSYSTTISDDDDDDSDNGGNGQGDSSNAAHPAISIIVLLISLFGAWWL